MCDDKRTGQVLVVDGNEEVRHCLHYALDSYGCEVVTCASGEEAMNRMAGRSPDYIIADADLPDMNGIELARRARQQAPSAVIIGLSVSDRGEEFLRAGANDFRRKPFVPYEIAMMIDGADLTDPVPAEASRTH